MMRRDARLRRLAIVVIGILSGLASAALVSTAPISAVNAAILRS